MRTIETKVYQFHELSEEAKKQAINSLLDINVDNNWWECTYDDAKEIGLKITGFNLDRNRHCTGKLTIYPTECAKLIIENHGGACETYKLAKNYLGDILVIDETTEDEGQEELTDIQDNFLKDLLEEYSSILQKEYEYLTSENSIIETIEANEYEFTENGKRI
jgi:hypothetical protein